MSIRSLATPVLAFAALLPSDGGPPPGRFVRAADGAEASWNEVARAARAAAVVYVGERHDDAIHHALQLAVLRALREANPEVVVGLEMLDRSAQEALDRYASRATDEETFVRESRWQERWGFPFALYRPVLSFAREHGVRLVALNAPQDLVRRVRREGLAGLDDRARLSLPAIDLDQEAHRRRVIGELAAAHHGVAADPAVLERYYQAMCIWDEVMADSVLGAFLRDRSPRLQVLVLAGRGHVETGDGVPERVRRRFPHPSLIIVPADADEPAATPLRMDGRPIADYVFYPAAAPRPATPEPAPAPAPAPRRRRLV